MKHNVLLAVSFMLVGLVSTASASSPRMDASCREIALNSLSVPPDIQAFVQKENERIVRICNSTATNEPIEFDLKTPSQYAPIGVCAYTVRHFSRGRDQKANDWRDTDAGGRKVHWTYMRLSENCDGDAGFVLVSQVSAGSFVRLSKLWNGLFSPEKMEKFLSALTSKDDQLDRLKAVLRAKAKLGTPVALATIQIEEPFTDVFLYFVFRFHIDGSTWLIHADFEGDGLSAYGWGWQS